MSRRSRRFVLGTFLISSPIIALGCDDKGDEKPAPVAPEAGKAQTIPGKQLERGKEQIRAAEKQMEVRDDKIINAANPEKVERGQVP